MINYKYLKARNSKISSSFFPRGVHFRNFFTSLLVSLFYISEKFGSSYLVCIRLKGVKKFRVLCMNFELKPGILLFHYQWIFFTQVLDAEEMTNKELKWFWINIFSMSQLIQKLQDVHKCNFVSIVQPIRLST